LAILCDVSPAVQFSKETLTNIEQTVGGLVDMLPKDGFTPRLINMYWTKGAAIVLCQDEETRNGGTGCSPCI
jgi:hypothetical protein